METLCHCQKQITPAVCVNHKKIGSRWVDCGINEAVCVFVCVCVCVGVCVSGGGGVGGGAVFLCVGVCVCVCVSVCGWWMVGAVWLVRQLCVVPNDGKRRQLLQVEGEIHAEVCAEQGCVCCMVECMLLSVCV